MWAARQFVPMRIKTVRGPRKPSRSRRDSGYTHKREPIRGGEMQKKKDTYSDAKWKLRHPRSNTLLCWVSDKRRHQTHAKEGDFILASFGKQSHALKGSTSQTACVGTVNNVCWLAARVAAVLEPRLAVISSHLFFLFSTLEGGGCSYARIRMSYPSSPVAAGQI